MKKFVIALILPVMAVLAGCASQIGANQYDSAAVGSVNRARAGTIVSVRAITVADSDNSLGTAIGGIAGGVGEGLLFKKGQIIKKVPQDQLVDELFRLIDTL